jgi:hypothetical protein
VTTIRRTSTIRTSSSMASMTDGVDDPVVAGPDPEAVPTPPRS